VWGGQQCSNNEHGIGLEQTASRVSVGVVADGGK